MLPQEFTPQFLRQLELFRLRTRRHFLGTRQGGHISLKRGHGIEFSDYRKYERGDNPRHIDWGVFARSDRLYVKTFQEEQDISLNLIIDASESMYTPADDHKWEMACNIALALGYVGLMSQDTVTLSLPGVFLSPSYYGARAIHSLARQLTQATPHHTRGVAESLRVALARIKFPGLAVFISDFLMPFEEIEEIVGQLRAKNLDITAIHVLGPSDLDPLEGKNYVIAVDSESNEEVQLTLDQDTRAEYHSLLDEHIIRVREFLAQSQIRYAFTRSTDPLFQFFVENLAKTGLVQ